MPKVHFCDQRGGFSRRSKRQHPEKARGDFPRRASPAPLSMCSALRGFPGVRAMGRVRNIHAPCVTETALIDSWSETLSGDCVTAEQSLRISHMPGTILNCSRK